MGKVVSEVLWIVLEHYATTRTVDSVDSPGILFECDKGRHRSLAGAVLTEFLVVSLGLEVQFFYFDVATEKHLSRLCGSYRYQKAHAKLANFSLVNHTAPFI